MGIYTQFKFGYAKETTFGSSAITGAGDTAYILGAFAAPCKHPSPVYQTIPIGPSYNKLEVDAGYMFEAQAQCRGFYEFRLQNGIPCWWAMGVSSTAGAGPYTHTITPYSDGSLLPSFTVNIEEEGSATDEEFQFRGVKVDSLTLSHDAKNVNCLIGKMEIMAASAADGIALTNAPALPATANTAPYMALERKYDTGGSNLDIDGLQRIDIIIRNGLEPLYTHSWSAGTYTGEFAYQFLEASMKEYEVQLLLHPSTIERVMWDDMIAHTNTKEAYFKWTRSTNDYIKVSLTNCHVVEHEKITPVAGEDMMVLVRIVPEAISIEVKDSIAGGSYGE